MRRPILFALAAGSAPCCCSSPASVTPPPCAGSDASHCPYYYTKPADSFYQVWINGQQSFVYQAEIPAKCKTGHINCARHCEPQHPSSPHHRPPTGSALDGRERPEPELHAGLHPSRLPR